VCIVKERNVPKIVVFGDSMMVVRAINKRIQFENKIFNNNISHILSLIDGFDEFKLYHVKRELNPLANHWEKLGTSLECGTISLNGVRGTFPIP
jgi:hypothetical protein